MEKSLNNTARVVIYGRTQHDPEALKRQLEHLKGVARDNGWQIVGVFSDLASANDPERQGYSEVLKMAEAEKMDIVLVSNLSRLWRKFLPAAKVLEEWQNRGIMVYQDGSGFICLKPDEDKKFETVRRDCL